MYFMELNGIIIHYCDEGPRDGPIIVFSNSLGTDFRIWDEVTKILTSRYRVIRYDKRGHGLSSCPTAPYKMNDHIKDLVALLDNLSVKNITLVGLSVGGLIAQGITSLRPDLIKALVLCDTAHKILTDDIWNERIRTVENLGLDALADSTMERWFSENFRKNYKPLLNGARNMFTRTPVAGYSGTCAAIRDTDFTSAAKRINCPTLCLVGDEDGSTPVGVVRELSKLIPNANFDIIKEAGHIPCIEKPKIVAHKIMDFIE